MKLEKGFTLIEVLGVLVIMALILGLLLPNIINNFYNNKSNYKELNENLIIEAARVYIDYNTNEFLEVEGSEYCIDIEDLVTSGALESENVTAFDDYSNYSVRAYYNGNYFELTLQETCNV